MITYLRSLNSKKGEIATAFLVLSILTLAAGAIIGLRQKNTAQTTNTQAQSATSCEYITIGSDIAGVRWTANGSTYEDYHKCQLTGGGSQAVSLMTQYRCENGQRIIDNNYSCAPGNCGTITSGNISYARCSVNTQTIPTVPVYPPNEPTPTTSYPNQPGLSLGDRIESVRPWPSESNITKLSNGNYQASFSLNFCRGTSVTGSTGNTELKYWIDDVPPGLPKIVKSSTTAQWNWPSPLSSNQCHSEAVTIELQGVTDQMLCAGNVMLRAHTWYNRGGAAGLQINPRGFKLLPQTQFCTPTATVTPVASVTPIAKCEYKSTVRLYEWFDDNGDNTIQDAEKRRPSVWPAAGSTKDINNPIYDQFTVRVHHDNANNENIWAVNRSVGGYDNDTIPKMVFQITDPATLRSFNYFPNRTVSPTSGPTPTGNTQSNMMPPDRNPLVNLEGGIARVEQLLPNTYTFVRTECKNIKGSPCVQPYSNQLNQVVYGDPNMAKLKFECNAEVEYAYVIKKTATPTQAPSATLVPTNRPSATSTPRPQPTDTPRPQPSNTPRPQTRNSFQIDIQPQESANDNSLQCWTLWNDNGETNIRGNAPESGVNCSGSANVNANGSELKVRLEVTRQGISNMNFDWQTNFCNNITRDCRNRKDRSHAATLSTGGIVECSWTNLANGGSTVNCTVVRSGNNANSDRTQQQPQPQTQPSPAINRYTTILRRIDLNNDGTVGVSDFFSWINQARSGQISKCDLNGDGLCNIVDATYYFNPQYMGQSVR